MKSIQSNDGDDDDDIVMKLIKVIIHFHFHFYLGFGYLNLWNIIRTYAHNKLSALLENLKQTLYIVHACKDVSSFVYSVCYYFCHYIQILGPFLSGFRFINIIKFLFFFLYRFQFDSLMFPVPSIRSIGFGIAWFLTRTICNVQRCWISMEFGSISLWFKEKCLPHDVGKLFIVWARPKPEDFNEFAFEWLNWLNTEHTKVALDTLNH